jgi:hypothetical protein
MTCPSGGTALAGDEGAAPILSWNEVAMYARTECF